MLIRNLHKLECKTYCDSIKIENDVHKKRNYKI